MCVCVCERERSGAYLSLCTTSIVHCIQRVCLCARTFLCRLITARTVCVGLSVSHTEHIVQGVCVCVRVCVRETNVSMTMCDLYDYVCVLAGAFVCIHMCY